MPVQTLLFALVRLILYQAQVPYIVVHFIGILPIWERAMVFGMIILFYILPILLVLAIYIEAMLH